MNKGKNGMASSLIDDEFHCGPLDELLSQTTNDVWLGLSGGMDSVVLLHLLFKQYFSPLLAEKDKPTYSLNRLKVVHVHHNLSPNADQWQVYCQQLCQQYHVHFEAHQVEVQTQGKSLEEGARLARYNVFTQCLNEGDALVLAHHANDQAETVLFRLMRGTGGKGIAGIPTVRKLAAQRGEAKLIRPLLHYSKQELAAYAQAQQLTWIEDESNFDDIYTRNAIRLHVMPAIEKLAPQAIKKISHSAERLAHDYHMLDALTAEKLAQWQNADKSLCLTPLQKMATTEKLFWLRHYLQHHAINLTLPQLEELEQAMFAAVDRQPLIQLKYQHIRRYQDRLYILPITQLQEIGPLAVGRVFTRQWDRIELSVANQTQYEPQGFCLITKPTQAELMLENGRSRSLKKWLNDLKVPVWWRDQLPYLTYQGQLVAIGSLWLAPEVKTWLTVDWQVNGKLPWPLT